MGTVENLRLESIKTLIYFAYLLQTLSTVKMSEAQDAFIIFDEAYEGNDVDAFYLGDILRALGCNVTNAKCLEKGMSEALGEKRIAYDAFLPLLDEILADKSSTGVKEDYIEGL